MTVLITGASGFIGKNLVIRLVEQGFVVKTLVRKSSNVNGFPKSVQIIFGDVTDKSSLELAVKDCDYIIHTAAVVKATKPEVYFNINTQGTINLVESVLEHNPNLKNLIFISSQAAAASSESPIDESFPSNPVTSYGKSKLEAERYLFTQKNKINFTILRPSAVFGKGDKEFLPLFKSIKRGIIPVVKGNKTRISMIYVDDLINMIIKIVELQKSYHQIYFVANPEAVELKIFYKYIRKSLNKKYIVQLPIPVIFLKFIAQFNTLISKLRNKPTMLNSEKVKEILNSWVCNPSKVIEATDYKFSESIEVQIQKTAQWYKDNKWL